MSRSYKNNSIGYFQYSPKRHAIYSCLYDRQNQISLDAEDDLEITYRDRIRHTSLRYPHYTSSYEDVCIASLSNKWSEQIKPFYCHKK